MSAIASTEPPLCAGDLYLGAGDPPLDQAVLSQSERRYALATSAGRVGVWDRDLQTDEVYADPIIARILGYEPQHMRTREDWLRCVHPDDAAPLMRYVEYAVQGLAPGFEMEFRMLHRDGGIRWFLSRGVVLRAGDGTPLRMIGTTTDITARKVAEQALRTSQEALRQSNARTQDLAGRLIFAQEEERRRVARELHDDLNQKVAALAIALSELRRQLPEPVPAVQELLIDLKGKALNLAEDIRKLSHELHPVLLEHAGLAPALRAFCTEAGARSGLQIEMHAPERIDGLAREVELGLYRIAQEALRNVVRHSGSARAAVNLRLAREGVKLEVEDAGCGFDAATVRGKGGLGLTSMEERVRLLQGTLRIDSKPGTGTQVCAWVPARKARKS